MADITLELAAMQEVAKALSDLEPDAIERVLAWAADSHGVNPPRTAAPVKDDSDDSADEHTFGRFSDLYDVVEPTSNPIRALVAGYWLQVVSGAEHFTGREVNDLLKDLGHELSNVTVAFRALQSRNPKLARQVAKSKGKSGHKDYRLTDAGVSRVQNLIRGVSSDDGG